MYEKMKIMNLKKNKLWGDIALLKCLSSIVLTS